MTYGYKTTEHADNYSYERTQENLVEKERKKLDDGLDMKYSVVGGREVENNEEYVVEWDPEILADLQKNIHN